MLMFALVKAVEIVGEAASQVSDEFRTIHPAIPWLDIIRMRHRLVHACFDINLDTLWDTVTANLPPLIAQLQRVLSEAENPSGTTPGES